MYSDQAKLLWGTDRSRQHANAGDLFEGCPGRSLLQEEVSSGRHVLDSINGFAKAQLLVLIRHKVNLQSQH